MFFYAYLLYLFYDSLHLKELWYCLFVTDESDLESWNLLGNFAAKKNRASALFDEEIRRSQSDMNKIEWIEKKRSVKDCIDDNHNDQP